MNSLIILSIELILNFFLMLFLLFLSIELFNLVILKKIPSLPTSSRVLKYIFKILDTEKGKVFIDLGCGAGKVLIQIKKRCPQMEVIGYENSLTQFLLAKIMIFFSGTKPKILYKDLFLADLKNADIVFCYLSSGVMPKIEAKFERELKQGTLFISNTFPLPNWKPVQTIITNEKNPNFEKLFIYKE